MTSRTRNRIRIALIAQWLLWIACLGLLGILIGFVVFWVVHKWVLIPDFKKNPPPSYKGNLDDL